MSQEQLDRLAEGIRLAHEAGNADHVKALGAEYRRLQASAGSPQTSQEPQGVFSSLGNAFRANVDPILEGVGTTLQVLGAEGAGQTLKDATSMPDNYVSGSERFMNADEDGSFAWRHLPSAIGEQVGQFAGSIGARAVGAAGGAAVGSMAGPTGTAVGGAAGAFAGPAAFEAMQILGPVALERAKNNGREEPNMDDLKWAATTAAGSGALNALAPGAQGFVKRFLIEGATEGAQSLVQQTGETGGTEAGLELDGRQALGEGIIGMGSAATVDSSIAGANTAVQAMPTGVMDNFSRIDRGDMTDDELRAADRLERAADGDMSVLANVGDTDVGSAKGAANAALRGIQAEVGAISRDLRGLAKYAGSRDAEIALDAVIRTARHQGSTTPETFQTDLKAAYQALAESGIESPDVERLGSLARQANVIQSFTKGDKGDMGGFSRFTSRFDISDPRSTSSLGGVAIAASGSFTTAGLTVAANRAARGLDRLTNNRSRVKRFVDSAKAQQREAPVIQGPTGRETLERLKLGDKVEQAVRRLQAGAGQAAAKGQAAPSAKQAQQAALDQSKAEAQARRYKVNAANNAAMFEAGQAPQNQDPMYAPYRLWEARIGKTGDEVVSALEALEAEGMAPQGSAQMYAEDIGGFTKMERNDLISLQEAVRQRINPTYQPKFDHLDKRGNTKPAPNAEEVLKKFKATDKGLTSSRGKQKAIEGDRRYKNLVAEIESVSETLSADQLQMLSDLAESINSPAITRAERFKLVNEMMPMIFPKRGQGAVIEIWRKKFTPLAAIGNDYAIERETDPVQAEKEEAFDKKVKEAKTKRPKVRTRKAANKNEAPATDRPAETKADQALRKLRKPQAKKPEPDTEATKARDAETPKRRKMADGKTEGNPLAEIKKPAQRKRASLAQEVENRIDDTYYSVYLATNEAQTLVDHVATLPKSPEGRVEGLIYEMGTDRVTVNMLADAYATKFDIPAIQAAQIVNNALGNMERDGMLKRRLIRNNARLKYDNKYVKDPNDDSKFLMSVDLQFHNPNGKGDGLNEDFYNRVQIAKAVNQVGKMVPQGGTDVEFGPQTLQDGSFRALKDIPPSRIDGTFKPIFDFLNYMRNTYHNVSPTILNQIEGALGGVNATKLGPIGEIMKPKDSNGRTDDSNVRTVAQLLMQSREAGNNLIRQEWMGGANLRVYSRNGLAHSQAGDIMKGLLRSSSKDTLGGEEGLNYTFHGIGNLLGFDKKPRAERRAAIFDNNLIEPLLKFADDPFGRLRLKNKKGELTDVGKMVNDSEGFFQALNAAHEIKNMVDWAQARHKDKKLKPAELLQDPEVRADLAQNYETDFIVQLDASNNAYQIAGMTMGYTDVLQSTGMLPPAGAEGDPDTWQGGDIYTQVAEPAAGAIQELADLNLPASKLRKLFKKPVGTYLYAAAFNSRRKAFEDAFTEIAEGNPIFGVNENGLIPVPEAVISEMQSGEGHTFVTPRFDSNGEPQKPSIQRKRIVAKGDKFIIETADGMNGEFKPTMTTYADEAEAVRAAYSGNFYARMNQELIKQMNVQFPGMRQYLNFAQKVSDIVKTRGLEAVNVPTKDGMMLEYSFRQNPEFQRADIALTDGNEVPIGVRGTDYKLAGRGLAAFMTHQNDAWALRETHKRLESAEPMNTFNPIHDSYGIHPRDAARTQRAWVDVMQELGAEDYNIFMNILEANNISMEELAASFKNPMEAQEMIQFIMGRQGVPKVDPSQLPTALS